MENKPLTIWDFAPENLLELLPPEGAFWNVAMGRQPNGYITSYAIAIDPKTFEVCDDLKPEEIYEVVQRTAIGYLVEHDKNYGVFSFKDEKLLPITLDKEDFFKWAAFLEKCGNAPRPIDNVGDLKTSTITVEDRLEMGKSYMEAIIKGLQTEGERVAYIDTHTHPHKHICSICGNEYFGWGHNAEPMVGDGRCCLACNNDFVFPYRIAWAEVSGLSWQQGITLIEEKDYTGYLTSQGIAA